MNSRILVATDGTDGSLGALRLARAIEERDGAQVFVISALEPLWPYSVETAAGAPGPESALERDRRERIRHTVEKQIREVGADPAHWIFHTEVGPPVLSIARYAHEHEVGALLLGIGSHTPANRWLGTETGLKVIQLTNVPVLAVQPKATTLPRRVLVAIDFSEYSLRAVQAARDLLKDGGEVHLVYVSQTPSAPPEWEETIDWVKGYQEGAQAQLEQLARELEADERFEVRRWLREGDPARELLAVADAQNVDLIAAGSHGRGFIRRLITGSVSTKLLRAAHCSVLIVPPSTLPPGIERPG